MTTTSRLSLCLLLLLLAACSVTSVPPTPPLPTAIQNSVPSSVAGTVLAVPQATNAPAITNIPAPTPPPSALILWAVAEGPRLDAIKQLVADLRRPDDAEVIVVGKSASGLVTDIRSDALAGLPPPDLVWSSTEDLGFLQREGMLQPADDGLEASAFLPAAIEGAMLDGQRWGTPLAAQGALLLLYNRALVDQPPRTTDELIVQSRARDGGDNYGLVAGWAEPRWLLALLTGFGGAPLSANGQPTLDTPQMLSALNLLKELRVAGPPAPSTYEAGVKLFRQGRAAFALDGDWSLDHYRVYSDTLDMGIAAMPVVPATGQVAVAPLGGVYLMYGRSLAGARREQALALGIALAQPPAQSRIARQIGQLPALRSALRDPAVAADPALLAAVSQAEHAPGLPPTIALHCAWRAIGVKLAPMLLGDLAPDDAARDMQASAEACMK
jgi:arabinogalactan oligomer / maltooligosaccharide transport system substrate-binding protein